MVRTERENASHPQELPKGEVVFSRQLTLRELLQIKPEESKTLEGAFNEFLFNDVPFDFEVRDLGNAVLHTASFSEYEPVNSSGLFLLLNSSKQGGISRTGQSIDGISADWRIILPEVREKEPNSKVLYDFHKRYVPEFSEFGENHFELFWKVLESGERREKEAQFFDRQLDQFIDERKFFAKYGRGRNFHTAQGIEKFAIESQYSESFSRFLGEKGFGTLSNPDPRDHPLVQIRKIFYSMAKQEQITLAIKFYKELVHKGGIEAEREFGSYLRWSDRGPSKTTLIGQGGELNRIGRGGVLKPLDMAIRERPDPNIRSQEPDGFRILDDGQIELTKGESFIRISFVKGEDGYKEVKLEDSHLPTEETMVPLIVWQRDKQTGKRSYYCGRLDQFPKHDTLLGQLVVSAYSRQVRDQMPAEIKMKGVDGKEKTQQMREAQAVLLVPRFANKFLAQSPVILGLEALAQNIIS